MNALVSLYPGDDAVRLAAGVAVQIAGVVLLALAAGWTVARRNAALRHGIWLAALAWVCVAPVAAWGLQRAGITIAVWHWPAKSASGGSRTAIGDVRHSDSGGIDQFSAVRTEQPRRPATPPDSIDRAKSTPRSSGPSEPETAGVTAFKAVFGALTAVWAVGAMLLLARLVSGLRVVASIWRELIPFADLPGAVGDRLRRTLGVKALPPIMLSRRVGGPATIGLRRPVVALPAEMAAAMTAGELHDALAHECAHALRHDGRIALVQQIAAAIYWLHPLVHVLNRHLARAREETCDNVVLSGTTAADYARTLLSLSQTMHAARGRIAVVQMFDKRWRLAHRVEGLLNTRRIVMTRINRRAVALVAVMALVFGTAMAAISTADDENKGAEKNPKTELNETRSAPRSDTEQTAVGMPDAGTFKQTADLLLKDLDAVYRRKLEEPRFDERKAELDVKEAKAVLDGKKLELQRLLSLKAQKSVSTQETDQAKLSTEVAEIHLEQAELALERAHLKVEQALPPAYVEYTGDIELVRTRNGDVIRYSREHGTSTSSGMGHEIDPSRGDVSVKSVIGPMVSDVEQDPSKAEMLRCALVRFKGNSLRDTLAAADQLKPSDTILVRDLLDGKAKDEIVHHGDFIILLGGVVKTPPAAAEKPKGTPKPKSNAASTDIRGTAILVKGDDPDESAATIAALWDIEGIDKTVHLTDDQKKVLTRIIEAHTKTQRDWMEKNAEKLEKLKAAEKAWVDATKGHDKAAIANAQKSYEDALAPFRDLEKKQQQELAAVLTPAQRAMLREHDTTTFLEWTIGPVKLSDEQRRKFREALNEVKETDYEPWERSERRLFVVEKIVVCKILTPEQKRTIFKHDAMKDIKLCLPGTDLSPEQLKKVDAAIDDLVKDQTPTLNGFRAAAAYKIVEAVRALLSDEQTQKVQAALKEQNQKFKAALKTRSNRE